MLYNIPRVEKTKKTKIYYNIKRRLKTMKKSDILKILELYEDVYKQMLFTGTDEAARTDNPTEAAKLEKITEQAAKQYELIKAIQDTIATADAAAEKANNYFKKGIITSSEKNQIISDEISKNIIKNYNEQITNIIDAVIKEA